MKTTTTIGMFGIAVAHADRVVPGTRLRASYAGVNVSVLRGWKQLPLVPRTASPIFTDNSTGVSVPGRRYRP